ncbi:uracil permease [Anoxybacter fermentans]|uniref:Uracil permease n=1 Tax=Anoxybacter fermentans TaxID=1323375 RepID=A0A3S9SWK2_9FIRM|nr:solute carrier family 23 protein [Anoxybacter fermentans]AZR72669.1 uracil permease [Anoxybacter fermentans]
MQDEKAIYDVRKLPFSQMILLGMQHALAMFGATVLVPILTGLNVSVALFTAGVGTWIFHLITKKKVPAYLGSSFAFIAPISIVVEKMGIPAAQGGIIVAGLVYAAMAFIIYLVGPKLINSLFPPIVTGPVIMVIGLTLAPVAIDMASGNLFVALVAILAAAFVSVFTRGFFRLIPVMMGLIAGYITALFVGIVDFTPLKEAAWFGLPNFTVPAINWSAILMIAPVAIVSMVEHVGDILAISATVGKGKEFVENPGIHLTMLGDGIATSVAGIFGGPPNTTYSENTGVLALTKVYDSVVMRIAAVFALILSLVPKLGALISTIPKPVIGGISILLFGMIASVGVRTMIENNVDLTKSRNLIIASVILVIGIGGATIHVGNLEFAGMGLAGLAGLVLNKLLPDNLGESSNNSVNF